MLKKLSLRNAKRQFQDYLLYFISLICSVAFMYAFNALIFSDSVKQISDMDIFPWLITATSLLIVFVQGWMIHYMSNYMLKRRSKEFSIYMLSGISNRTIAKLIFQENILIGGFAFLLGIPFGVLLSCLLEAVLLNVFGMNWQFHVPLSLKTVGLTFFYFATMLLHSLRKNRRWIHRIKLYDMLMTDKRNEKTPAGHGRSAGCIFFVSILLCIAGVILIITEPWGKGYDILTGIIFLVLFLFGFFLSVPSFLVMWFQNRNAWKYGNNRLVIFRGFTSKIHSLSMVMGILSVLFMLVITLFGMGVTVSTLLNRHVSLNVFDMMFLHRGEMRDFTVYDDSIDHIAETEKRYAYCIYTGTRQEFRFVRDNAVLSWHGEETAYTEFEYDTYMKQSDYMMLRDMLGYRKADLRQDAYYIHCTQALETDFLNAVEQRKNIEAGGYSLTAGSVFSEPFNQYDAYGNGWGYIIVVPDHILDKMEAAHSVHVLYSLYAVLTKSPVGSYDLQRITEEQNGLTGLDWASGSGGPDSYGFSVLMTEDVDYLAGKWQLMDELIITYSLLICMFYLALILEITGAAILATQVLSGQKQKRRQDETLRQLGMKEHDIRKLNNCQLSLLYLIPLLPAGIISSCLIRLWADRLDRGMVLPVFMNRLWIGRSFAGALIFFFLIYGIYYAAALISYGRRQPG